MCTSFLISLADASKLFVGSDSFFVVVIFIVCVLFAGDLSSATQNSPPNSQVQQREVGIEHHRNVTRETKNALDAVELSLRRQKRGSLPGPYKKSDSLESLLPPPIESEGSSSDSSDDETGILLARPITHQTNPTAGPQMPP